MLHTQQLLSICDFAASKSSASYADVAAHLNISEDEVEMWIVEAISSGIVEANMNQMAGTVTFRLVYLHCERMDVNCPCVANTYIEILLLTNGSHCVPS